MGAPYNCFILILLFYFFPSHEILFYSDCLINDRFYVHVDMLAHWTASRKQAPRIKNEPFQDLHFRLIISVAISDWQCKKIPKCPNCKVPFKFLVLSVASHSPRFSFTIIDLAPKPSDFDFLLESQSIQKRRMEWEIVRGQQIIKNLMGYTEERSRM